MSRRRVQRLAVNDLVELEQIKAEISALICIQLLHTDKSKKHTWTTYGKAWLYVLVCLLQRFLIIEVNFIGRIVKRDKTIFSNSSMSVDMTMCS